MSRRSRRIPAGRRPRASKQGCARLSTGISESRRSKSLGERNRGETVVNGRQRRLPAAQFLGNCLEHGFVEGLRIGREKFAQNKLVSGAVENDTVLRLADSFARG